MLKESMEKFRRVSCFLLCCIAGILYSVPLVNTTPLCSWGPWNFVVGETRKLDCDFSFPIRVVRWYKNGNEPITNGTGGLYQSHEKLNDGKFRSTLHFPTVRLEHEGNYTCKTDTSQTTSCPNGPRTTDIYVHCGEGYIKAGRNMVLAQMFSNTSLRCSTLSWKNCFIGPVTLTWHYRNRILQNSTKYTIIEEHKTNECQRRLLQSEFILKISNVTDEDSGEYFCQLYCNLMKRIEKAAIKLVAVVQPAKEPETNISTEVTYPHLPTSRPVAKWIVPIVCSSVFLVIILAVACLLKKSNLKFSRKRSSNCKAELELVNNKIFISYSSKDFAWLSENLISLLDKHSIPYSIHIRDFELGKPIVQNMADSVYGSRQVLIVMSDNYLASNFCREELQMAIQRIVDTEDSYLILVTIDNFKKKRLPSVLRKTNVLDFEKHKRKQDWEEKLLNAVLDAQAVTV